MLKCPSKPARPSAATVPFGRTSWMSATPGRGAHWGSGGIRSTGQTGLKSTVPFTAESASAGVVVDVVTALTGAVVEEVAGTTVVSLPPSVEEVGTMRRGVDADHGSRFGRLPPGHGAGPGATTTRARPWPTTHPGASTPLPWGGAGARLLGLQGAVTDEQYSALYGPGGACDPTTGERLVNTKRPGLELVISAHNSVAELGVIGRTEDMHAIMDAERDATLAYLDDLTRRLGGRRGRRRCAPRQRDSSTPPPATPHSGPAIPAPTTTCSTR